MRDRKSGRRDRHRVAGEIERGGVRRRMRNRGRGNRGREKVVGKIEIGVEEIVGEIGSRRLYIERNRERRKNGRRDKEREMERDPLLSAMHRLSS